MKRLAMGVVVVALLALGTGMFANLGTTVAGPVAHHPAASRPQLRPSRTAMAATPSPATPHARVPAAHHGLSQRPARSQRPATTRSATTVQIVDPSSVTLPPTCSAAVSTAASWSP
jgi:hypothetical protein